MDLHSSPAQPGRDLNPGSPSCTPKPHWLFFTEAIQKQQQENTFIKANKNSHKIMRKLSSSPDFITRPNVKQTNKKGEGGEKKSRQQDLDLLEPKFSRNERWKGNKFYHFLILSHLFYPAHPPKTSGQHAFCFQ